MSEDLKMENLLPLSPELSSRINQNARLMQSPQETFSTFIIAKAHAYRFHKCEFASPD